MTQQGESARKCRQRKPVTRSLGTVTKPLFTEVLRGSSVALIFFCFCGVDDYVLIFRRRLTPTNQEAVESGVLVRMVARHSHFLFPCQPVHSIAAQTFIWTVCMHLRSVGPSWLTLICKPANQEDGNAMAILSWRRESQGECSGGAQWRKPAAHEARRGARYSGRCCEGEPR